MIIRFTQKIAANVERNGRFQKCEN